MLFVRDLLVGVSVPPIWGQYRNHCARSNEGSCYSFRLVQHVINMLAHDPAPPIISSFVETSFLNCHYKEFYSFWSLVSASSSCDQNLSFEMNIARSICSKITRDKNSERWITRLVCRWRAQPAVWINVNCRTLWTSTSWTHIAATISVVATPVRGSASYLSSHPLSDGIQCFNSLRLQLHRDTL